MNTRRMTPRLLFAALTVAASVAALAHAHEAHGSFSAGEPGDPKQPARIVKVSMQEQGKKLRFDPALIEVRKGEQIRFVLFNEGTESHEFVLSTAVENRNHAELMKQFPKMEHADPNARRLAVFEEGDLVWKFTKPGTFEFACLIPGHYQAGMRGTVIVK